MFEKLLSQLPYNPGLAHQMSFYSRRMREEASIRRMGMVFILLAFFVQFFAVLNPPQPSVAASNNDLLNGGISGAADAARNCNANTQHYKNVLENYGITCQQVANASTVRINSDGQNFYSFGRIPQGYNSEQPVNIPNLGTIYVRKLSAWGHNVSYQALQLTASTGKTFWILYQCGNLVSIGIPTPVNQNTGLGGNQPVTHPQTGIGGNRPVSRPNTPPAPTNIPSTPSAPNTPPANCQQSVSSANPNACLAISKTAANTTQNLPDANNTTAQAGDVIVYTLYVKNSGTKDVTQYAFQENLSDVMDYADVIDAHGGNLSADSGLISWPKIEIKAGKTVSKQITVKVKSPVPQTPVSASDPNRFDLIMTNVYGNTININLPGSVGKTVETTGTTLPNTGPGTNILIGSVIVIVAGYFYSRARLLTKESRLALQEGTSL